MNESLIKNKAFWTVLLIAALTLLPFIGMTEYQTKGEPRESIVSLSMLETGNWVLPRNNGGEMAYKPPFFHWCVAACSAVQGEVSEGSSRLPSALALIIMTACGFIFFARRKGVEVGILASLIAFTTFELHRAGANCRVDMVLTALTVCALYALFRWYEKGKKGIGWVASAILLMGLGTLTKGPVGSIIPCLVMGLFMLLRGENFFRAFFTLFLFGILSLIPYALWFYAAYNQGGQEFLDLMYEENIGRMTNTMGYESCVHPWPYNIQSVVLGFLPWTLMLVLSLFFLKYRKPSLSPANWWTSLRTWWNRQDMVSQYALTAAVTIFVFYCIPQSKRSVYLMPLFPFASYFVAQYILWMSRHARKVMYLYGSILSVLSIVLVVAFFVLKLQLIPESLFTGRHAAQNIRMLHALEDISAWWQIVCILLPGILGAMWWKHNKRDDSSNIYFTLLLTFGIYFAIDSTISPTVMNTKSIKDVSIEIGRRAPESEGGLYEFIEASVKAKGDPIHFFEVNFYLNNRIGNFYKERPAKGYLLMLSNDVETNLPIFEKEGYTFTLVYDPQVRDMLLYRFEKKQAETAQP